MKYTTEDLAEGKVAIKYGGNLRRLRIILAEAFPEDQITTEECCHNMYCASKDDPGQWTFVASWEELPSNLVSETDILLMSELVTEDKCNIVDDVISLQKKIISEMEEEMDRLKKEVDLYKSLSETQDKIINSLKKLF